MNLKMPYFQAEYPGDLMKNIFKNLSNYNNAIVIRF